MWIDDRPKSRLCRCGAAGVHVHPGEDAIYVDLKRDDGRRNRYRVLILVKRATPDVGWCLGCWSRRFEYVGSEKPARSRSE